MLAGDVGVVDGDVTLTAASHGGAPGADDEALAAHQQQRGLLARAGALLQGLGDPPSGAVDHGAPRGLLLRGEVLVGLGLRVDHPRLDPELPEAETIVGLELHQGARRQHQALAAGMLQQVAGQL